MRMGMNDPDLSGPKLELEVLRERGKIDGKK